MAVNPETPEWLIDVLHTMQDIANGDQDACPLAPGRALAALVNVPADVLDAAGCCPVPSRTRWSGASFVLDGVGVDVGGVSVDADVLANARQRVLGALPDASVDITGTFDGAFDTTAVPETISLDGVLLIEHAVVVPNHGITVRPGVDWIHAVQSAHGRVVRRRVLVFEDWQDVPDASADAWTENQVEALESSEIAEWREDTDG